MLEESYAASAGEENSPRWPAKMLLMVFLLEVK